MHILFKHGYRGKKEFDENRHIYILIKNFIVFIDYIEILQRARKYHQKQN